MEKCDSCGKETEHITTCASCGKNICPSCAHHYQGRYLCNDCLKGVYTHPVRKEEEVPEQAPVKAPAKSGFRGTLAAAQEKAKGQQGKGKPATPNKPTTTNKKLPMLQIVSLIIVIAFFAVGWTYMSQGPAANATENETIVEEIIVPEVTITQNDTLNIYPHMISYLEITGYNLTCTNYTVTEIEFYLKAGPLPITLSSVELFDKNILDEFTNKKFSANSISKTTFRNVPTYADINALNTTKLELIFVGNRGTYQKAILTPDPRNCPE